MWDGKSLNLGGLVIVELDQTIIAQYADLDEKKILWPFFYKKLVDGSRCDTISLFDQTLMMQ